MKPETLLNDIREELSHPKADYGEAKEQSRRIDASLGFRCESIEGELFDQNRDPSQRGDRQFWFGLDVQSMQTPYSEIVEMIRHLDPQPGETWVDLGAAYGRIGIVLSLLRPAVVFRGYEFVAGRVDEGQRIFKQWGFKNAHLARADLASPDFELPESDLYFIYDFGSRSDVFTVLEKLRQVASRRPIRVIARGRGVRNWITMSFPWLAEMRTPEHFPHWSVFRS